jgi:hypothetical protein
LFILYTNYAKQRKKVLQKHAAERNCFWRMTGFACPRCPLPAGLLPVLLGVFFHICERLPGDTVNYYKKLKNTAFGNIFREASRGHLHFLNKNCIIIHIFPGPPWGSGYNRRKT